MFPELKDTRLPIHQKSLKVLFLIILLLGLCFRFVNLDRKVYWGDEAFTSLALSGHTIVDVEQEFLPGEIINIQELADRYQKINPEHKLGDTINVLTKDVHPPLYYTLLYFWNSSLGNGVAVTRSLSAVISCLVFPSIYWLCWELFNSSLIAWIGMSLIAISPFHVLYAQEARMYSLWTVTILLSSAALLRAINNKNRLNWLIYATTLALGLYTYTQQRLWKAIAVSTITAGVISCTISSQSEFWWNKRTSSYDYLQASRIINQQNKPLLIAEKMFATLPLTHTLNSTTDLLVANTAADIEIPRYYDRIYLLQPSKQLKYKLEQQGYKLNIAYKGRKQSLWQLEKS